ISAPLRLRVNFLSLRVCLCPFVTTSILFERSWSRNVTNRHERSFLKVETSDSLSRKSRDSSLLVILFFRLCASASPRELPFFSCLFVYVGDHCASFRKKLIRKCHERPRGNLFR